MSIAEVAPQTHGTGKRSVYAQAARRSQRRGEAQRVDAYLSVGGGARRGHRKAVPDAILERRDRDWRPVVPAYDYARSQLRTLQQQHADLDLPPTAPEANSRMVRLLRDVLAEDSVYPTMSIDEDGGIIAEWRASVFSLEIDVDPDGTASFTLRRDGLKIGSGKSVTPLRKIIRDFSAVVAKANPNWKALFPTAHAHGTR